MKKKTNNLISLLLIMGALGFFVNSCKKDEVPELTTIAITDIMHNTAKSGGNITYEGGSKIIARGVCWSTHETPTISDNKTTDGSGIGSFFSTITGLSVNTVYYVRAYATNSDGTGYGNTLSFTSANTFTDTRDGNVYSKVTIGAQTWMAENLRYLPSVVGPGSNSQTTPYYYVYDYDGTVVAEAKATENYTTYGVLYNWPAAMNGASASTANPSGVQGVCPTGWHMPSNEEWKELFNFLGGNLYAGGKLKATILWNSPNEGASNSTGFSALPGGEYYDIGAFQDMGEFGYWWTTTNALDVSKAYSRYLSCYNDYLDIRDFNKEWGASVRCVKD